MKIFALLFILTLGFALDTASCLERDFHHNTAAADIGRTQYQRMTEATIGVPIREKGTMSDTPCVKVSHDGDLEQIFGLAFFRTGH